MSSSDLEFPAIAAIYGRFAALMAMSSDMGGWLLLYSGLDRDGIAVAMASNVAGVASLGIEPDVVRAKQALRAGVSDFVVNNLDEALRILKNEIRKKRGVSVILTSQVASAVAEMVARGVQPDVLAFPVPELIERGARVLPADAGNTLTPVLWSVADDASRWLPDVDALAVASLAVAGARVRWIETSPRYLGRAYAGQRFLPMANAEADAFVAEVRKAVSAGAISAAVTVVRGGEAVSIKP